MKKSTQYSSSSSSSSIGFENPIQLERKRVVAKKNATKNLNVKSQNCKEKKNQTNGSSKRSSIYRGVTRHRWTGRFEAHLWDKSSWNKIQNKKGRQVYLGAYDTEEAAARTYDLASLKYWGKDATLNFPIETYTKEIEEMNNVSKEEHLASLRRQSSGFSRGISKYRGVARHHHNGRWEARIGRVCGNKYLYLGTYKTQEEAAVAYDMAAIEYRGMNAVTNFDISNYLKNKKTDESDQTEPQKATTITEIVPNSSDSELAASEEQTTITTPPQENQLKMEPFQHDATPIVQEDTLVNVMDNYLDQDFPWSLMYNGLSVIHDNTSSAMSKCNDEDLINMFDGSSFEEDIGFMFNTEEPFLEGIDCGGLINEDGGNIVGVNDDGNYS